MITILIILSVLTVINIIFTINKSDNKISDQIENTIFKFDKILQNQFQINRKETSDDLRANREELTNTLVINNRSIQDTVSTNLKEIKNDTNSQLEKIKDTVDEKLQKTINERLKQSFSSVATQLESVNKGVGEMKNLAADVGGLKKVLSNVKTRGNFGEMQLEMLLENIFSPGQFSKNVRTNPNSSKTVEFAINFPGKNNVSKPTLLPIDVKFPMDIYNKLLDAYDLGKTEEIKKARKDLSNKIKTMASDIFTKYICPPNTTDFALLYLPFEGIYAEVTRDNDLCIEVQKKYKVTITGPSTICAILNGFQVGFKTLAIEKRTSEIQNTLIGVKKEFSNFSSLMGKAQTHFKNGMNVIDEVLGVRTRAIERKLKDFETGDGDILIIDKEND